MIGSERLWWSAAVITSLSIAASIIFGPDPNSRIRSAIAIHDFGHVVAFGLMTVLLALALSARLRPTFRGRIGATCLAAGSALVVGASVEVAQAVSGSHGDPWDVVRDGGGAFSVALILIAFDSSLSFRARVALGGVATFVLAAFTYPIFSALNDEAHARTQFPVLAGFGSKSELSRFHFSEGTRPKIVQITDEEGQAVSAMQLDLPPGTYPGFELRYFPGDWHGVRALKLLILNPEPTPTELGVRIDDTEYRLNFDDRYNRSFPLLPGVNRIDIQLSDVAAAPRGRRFDLGRVHTLLVFAIDLKEPRTIFIGPIVLLR
jgi:hypothetical protein